VCSAPALPEPDHSGAGRLHSPCGASRITTRRPFERSHGPTRNSSSTTVEPNHDHQR
jgi:hypothetical protein